MLPHNHYRHESETLSTSLPASTDRNAATASSLWITGGTHEACHLGPPC